MHPFCHVCMEVKSKAGNCYYHIGIEHNLPGIEARAQAPGRITLLGIMFRQLPPSTLNAIKPNIAWNQTLSVEINFCFCFLELCSHIPRTVKETCAAATEAAATAKPPSIEPKNGVAHETLRTLPAA
jgi:hypothetical protein